MSEETHADNGSAPPTRPPAKLLWLMAALALLLVVLAYGRVLSFPYLFDDPIHVRWLAAHDLGDVWGDVRGLQHYRPLVFTLWTVSWRLFGPENPLPLHGVTLLLHAANALLVGGLSWRMTRRRGAALLAVALLATFPFSYQVMPSPGSLGKPLSAFLLLLSAACYWDGRLRRTRWRVGLALLGTACAPFAYEGAVTGGGILLLVEGLLLLRGSVPRAGLWKRLVLLALGVPFLIVWRLVPNSYDAIGFPGFEALMQSSVYFAQGLTWPVALIAKSWMRRYGGSDLGWTAVVAIGTLGLLLLVARMRRRLPEALFGLLWATTVLLVQWLTLSFRYVIDGPRLLYGAAVGFALLWSEEATWTWDQVTSKWLPRGLLIISALLMVGWGLAFGRARMQMVGGGAAALEDAADLTTGTGETSWLLINVPHWVAPSESAFCLGHEGYTVLPPYYGVSPADWIYANRGERPDVRTISIEALRQEWHTLVGYHPEMATESDPVAAIRHVDQVALLCYEQDRLCYRPVGGVDNCMDWEGEALATFEGVCLANAELHVQDGATRLSLLWWVAEGIQELTTVFVHCYGPDGALVAQADGAALGNSYAVSAWRAGERIDDHRYLALPEGVSLQDCTLGVGLYRSDTGERLEALDAEGGTLSDQMLRLDVSELLGY